jgi:hypothetical protein
MWPNPPISPDVFAADVLPLVVEHWSRRCLCGNPGFLKLLSFDFLNYGHTPAELIDAELIWGAIVNKQFVPRGDWSSSKSARPCRTFRCPQCGLELVSESEQYSINMWPTTSRATDNRYLAPKGYYIVGIRSVGDFDFQSVRDFALAESVPSFLANIGAT